MDTAHEDEMLALTLDVDDERRKRGADAAFDGFAHEHAEQSEALLALPASPTLLPLSSSPRQRQQQLSVQQYFQTDAGTAGTDFNTEMQKSNDEYRRLTDAMTLAATGSNASTSSTATQAASSQSLTLDLASTSATPRKKRKAGCNVSVDLQTKIRLIEVAEQYQYDPKGASRKQDVATTVAAHQGKEQMSGIRLAAQFGLNKSTVSRILKRKEEFKKAYYKDNVSGCSKHINKKSKYEKLNRLVENWYDVTRDKNVVVSDTHLREVGRRFAEELGIEDFRGSNGWVRSLRNRKENQSRNLSMEALEIERIKKDAEAIERIRQIFPNGVKDMTGFFKDLSIYLEKDGGGMAGFSDLSGNTSSSSSGSAQDGALSYTDMEDEAPRDEEAIAAEEALKRKMVDSLRNWSRELKESELAKDKQRMKPRQAAML